MKTKNIIVLLAIILAIQFVGIIGTLFQSPDMSWYNSLNKPFFNPPSFLFGPVWVTLYFLIAISVFLIYIDKKIEQKTKNKIYAIFLIQIILNGIWTPIFFGYQNILLALIIIIILLLTIIYLESLYFKHNKKSFYLFFPYILWVGFATILNFSIYLLN